MGTEQETEAKSVQALLEEYTGQPGETKKADLPKGISRRHGCGRSKSKRNWQIDQKNGQKNETKYEDENHEKIVENER